jgi:orotate phosphoribosyltransferase
MDFEKEVAQALLNIGAVGFKPKEPVTFKSGIVSPVYCDNRKFPFHPNEWRKVIEGFKHLIVKEKIEADVIAGVEAAGIPHSAALGFFMDTPSVFVRKEAKDHGLKKRVEGGDVTGKKVALVEDLVSTGSSSLSVIEALRNEGAVVNDLIVIVTYGFKESEEAFEKANVKLHALTSFLIILDEALAMNKFTSEEKSIIEDWFKDPHGWRGRQGLK